jgi:hypothetical protein
MKNIKSQLSKTRIERIKAQGYQNYSDLEVTDLAFGNRFAYILCTCILIAGVASGSVAILSAMTFIAFLGAITAHHPFDYIYNYGIRKLTMGPKLPPRSKQLKFACTIATLWLVTTTYFFYSGQITAGTIAGLLLIAIASLVSTTDICIPSIIYNNVFKEKTDTIYTENT